MKIKDYADLFVPGGYWQKRQEGKKISHSEDSLKTKMSILNNRIIPLFGEYHPKKLTPKLIDDALMGLESEFTGRELAGDSLNRILSVLGELYQHLLQEGAVKYNPVKDIARFRIRRVRPRGVIPLADQEILFPKDHGELIRIWRTQRFACAFLILRDTGLRPGELVALKWSDWDPEIRFFPITKALACHSRTIIKGTKTGTTKPALVSEQAALELEILRKKVKPKPDDFIFRNIRQDLPYTSHRLIHNFREGVIRAGLDHPEWTPYWLRHSFNTHILVSESLATTQMLMGHNTIGMTQHYRHAGPDILRMEALKIRASRDSLAS
jgi:integrase